MSNDLEQGLNYFDDQLSTSIEGGVYTLDFTSYKDNPNAAHLIEGHLVTFLNDQDVRVILTIMSVEEISRYKKVYCEDTSLSLINRVVDEIKKPDKAMTIDYYLKDMLKDTGWEVGKNESKKSLSLEYNSTESLLSRLRKITTDFEVEFYFEPKMDNSGMPDFYINIVENRVEGEQGFRVSSDDFLEGITRKVSIDNIVTRLIVKANESKTENKAPTNGYSRPYTESPIYQVPASKYDSSKLKEATSLSTSGWDANWVNKFRLNQSDPPYINGIYIDNWLRKYYPDSKLIGHGAFIKQASDYFGVSVGAALGVWAKETTFGRGEPGRSHNNFGCIMWTTGSPYNKVYFGDRNWNSYPSAKVGIMAWFKLIRDNYLNTGQITYNDFLNKYSPSFENNQATFKNLMWGVLKAFGYDTSDTGVKTNYSKPSDNPLTLEIPIGIPKQGASQTTTKTLYDQRIDRMLKWFYDRKGKVRYSMTYRAGPNSYDCSSSVFSALIYAGFKPSGTPLGSTVTLWSQVGSFIREIPRSEARRGDIFLGGPRGVASGGKYGHTGLFVSNSRIIHCNGSDNGISETVVEGRTGSPLACFRIIDTTNGATSNPVGPSNKVEKAVQNCLAGVGRTPYIWGGTSTNGWDCSGMIYNAYRAAGFTINHRCTTGTIMSQTSPFYKISRSEARRGDVVITNSGNHVAVLLGSPDSGQGIVHASEPRVGTVIWKTLGTGIVGFYRLRE